MSKPIPLPASTESEPPPAILAFPADAVATDAELPTPQPTPAAFAPDALGALLDALESVAVLRVQFTSGAVLSYSSTPSAVPEPAPVAPTSSPWPPSHGWHVRPGEFAIGGRAFPLRGRMLEILTVLAETPGDPVTVKTLRDRIWGTYDIDDGGIRSWVARLREELGKLLCVENAEDVLPAGFGGAYRLLTPERLLSELSPAPERSHADTPRASWPPPSGWAFRPGEFSFDGRVYPLTGVSLRLLQYLAERQGEPIPTREICEAVWPNYDVDERSLRSAVTVLRGKLRDLFGLYEGESFISRSDNAYRLDAPPAPRPGQPRPPIAHSDDFRSVRWYGTTYTLTRKQSLVVARLWEAMEKDVPDVEQSRLLAAAESDCTRLSDLFKRSPAWGVLIVVGSYPGAYRLAPPAEEGGEE